MNKQASKIYYFFVVMLFLFLTSCGAKKRVNKPLYGYIPKEDSRNKKTNIPTDASDSRDITWSYSAIKNYAALLNVDEYVINRSQALYRFIDDWKGSPHRMGGLSKGGVDCSAFVNMLYQDIYRKSLPRSSREMAENIKRKYDNQLKEGDLVFFSFGGRQIDHVGVYLHNNKFVHVSTSRGVIISDLKDPWYYRHIRRCGTPRV